jgi:hypothetical protein
MKHCLLLTVLLGLCGCASGPPLDLAPDVRATLGTTGIMARDRSADLDYSMPTTGATSGAWNALKLWEEMSRGRLYCGGLPFLPLFGIGGAMIGGGGPG